MSGERTNHKQLVTLLSLLHLVLRMFIPWPSLSLLTAFTCVSEHNGYISSGGKRTVLTYTTTLKLPQVPGTGSYDSKLSSPVSPNSDQHQISPCNINA